MPLPCTSIKPYLRSDGRRLALIGSSPTQTPTVVLVDPHDGSVETLASTDHGVDLHYLSRPQRVEFCDQEKYTHALLYPPTNPAATGPASERPPLIVRPHPGPTASSPMRLDLQVQLFTSRGFAVVDVDYGGSTGYGRAYRARLSGRWGVVDVDDCVRTWREATHKFQTRYLDRLVGPWPQAAEQYRVRSSEPSRPNCACTASRSD